MNAEDRLHNILLSTKLGPVVPFCGLVDGECECGKPRSRHHKAGKHPRNEAGWQEKATTDEHTIIEWFRDHPNANFATITGVGSVVLDLDVRPDKDGVAELAKLENDVGQSIPATVTVLSGSGSGARHLYFRVPSDLPMLQKPTGTKGIDFLRSRQAVILPGSLHESGQFYAFAPGLSPADVELAELPEWLLARMRKASNGGKRKTSVAGNIEGMFEELRRSGPPEGSPKPGRLRSDEIVLGKMRNVPMRMYPDDRSHSDSHWAWTLARNCCHHWEQYLRLWRSSPIRTLPDTKCGRSNYEESILVNAFKSQSQQWKSKLTARPVEESANVAITKWVRKQKATKRETPRSEMTKVILQLHGLNPDLDDNGLARMLNAARILDREVTRNNVKRVRHCYPHLW